MRLGRWTGRISTMGKEKSLVKHDMLIDGKTEHSGKLESTLINLNLHLCSLIS